MEPQYKKIKQEEMDSFTNLLAEKIKEAGYYVDSINHSHTGFGNSNYINVVKNKGDYAPSEGKKVRISDHGVENHDRIFNEIHVSYVTGINADDYSSVIYELKFYFDPKKYFDFKKHTNYYKQEMEVGEKDLREDDEIISERSKVDFPNKKVYTVNRKKYSNVVQVINKETRKIFSEIDRYSGNAVDLWKKNNLSGAERFSKIKEINRNEITVQPEFFQGRQTAYSEETVNKIISEGFDKSNDPIIVWWNNSIKKYVIISGHSRWEASQRLYKGGDTSLKKMPIKEFMGDKYDAIQYAVIESNRASTQEGLISDIKVVKKMITEGFNKIEMIKYIKPKSYLEKVINLTFLDSEGKFIEYLNSDAKISFPYLERNADWIGMLRKMYREKITNAHEDEIFSYLYLTSQKPLSLRKEELFNLIDKKVQNITFNPAEPLNLKNIISTSPLTNHANILIDGHKHTIEAMEKEISRKQDLIVSARHENKNELVEQFEKTISILTQRIIEEKTEISKIQFEIKKIEQSTTSDLFTEVKPKIMEKSELEFQTIPIIVRKFMPLFQQKIVSQNIIEFQDAIKNIKDLIEEMPVVYKSAEKAKDKIIYLHYFYGGSDWYVVEKDSDNEQLQAFGYVILNSDEQNAEWGYISIEEIKLNGKVELDFYWKKQTFRQLKAEKTETIHEHQTVVNLIPVLKSKFEKQINDYGITEIFIAEGEVHISSKHDIPADTIAIIEAEAFKKEHKEIEESEEKGEAKEAHYISYLNKDNKFKETKKEFYGKNSYEEAVKWGRENLENFNTDMVRFKHDEEEIEEENTPKADSPGEIEFNKLKEIFSSLKFNTKGMYIPSSANDNKYIIKKAKDQGVKIKILDRVNDLTDLHDVYIEIDKSKSKEKEFDFEASYKKLPAEAKAIIDTLTDDSDYADLKRVNEELAQYGYGIEYSLDAEVTNIFKVKKPKIQKPEKNIPTKVAPVKTKITTSSDEALKFMSIIVSWNDQTKTREQLLNFIFSMQKAVEENKIEKKSPHFKDFQLLEMSMVELYNSTRKQSIKIELENSVFKRWSKIAEKLDEAKSCNCTSCDKHDTGLGKTQACPAGNIQSLLLSKNVFSKNQAIAWAKKHNFKHDHVDIGGERALYIRLSQEDPEHFIKESFKTISFKTGIKATYACPKKGTVQGDSNDMVNFYKEKDELKSQAQKDAEDIEEYNKIYNKGLLELKKKYNLSGLADPDMINFYKEKDELKSQAQQEAEDIEEYNQIYNKGLIELKKKYNLSGLLGDPDPEISVMTKEEISLPENTDKNELTAAHDPEITVRAQPKKEIAADTDNIDKVPIRPIVSAKELQNKNFKLYNFTDPWRKIFGMVTKPFSVLMFGQPKSYKSTFIALFADYFAKNFGTVLYVASEEYDSPTLQARLKRLNVTADKLFISKDTKEIPNDLIPDLIIIDTINKAGIKNVDMIELKQKYPNTSFIFIAQVTKDGDFRGENATAHDVDAIIEMKNGEAFANGRFIQGGYLNIKNLV